MQDEEVVRQIILGVRSLSVGVHMLVEQPKADVCNHLQDDPLARLSIMQHRYLDSFGWQPLFDAWDYQATERRLVADVFAVEASAAEYVPP